MSSWLTDATEAGFEPDMVSQEIIITEVEPYPEDEHQDDVGV